MIVDPAQLVYVDVSGPAGQTTTVVAITCRFVPTTETTGRRVVAVELVTDPAQPLPSKRYDCPPERLRRQLLPPASVVSMRPYVR